MCGASSARVGGDGGDDALRELNHRGLVSEPATHQLLLELLHELLGELLILRAARNATPVAADCRKAAPVNVQQRTALERAAGDCAGEVDGVKVVGEPHARVHQVGLVDWRRIVQPLRFREEAERDPQRNRSRSVRVGAAEEVVNVGE